MNMHSRQIYIFSIYQDILVFQVVLQRGSNNQSKHITLFSKKSLFLENMQGT